MHAVSGFTLRPLTDIGPIRIFSEDGVHIEEYSFIQVLTMCALGSASRRVHHLGRLVGFSGRELDANALGDFAAHRLELIVPRGPGQGDHDAEAWPLLGVRERRVHREREFVPERDDLLPRPRFDVIEVQRQSVPRDEVITVAVRRVELDGAVPAAFGLVSGFRRYARQPLGELVP